MKKWCFFVLMCSVHIGGASEYRGSILLWPRTKRSLFHQIPFSLKFSFGKISMGYRNLKVPEVTTIATLGWSSDHETNALARALRAGTARETVSAKFTPQSTAASAAGIQVTCIRGGFFG